MNRRIKILFYMETIDGGGAEKVLRNLVNNMNQQEFEITVQTAFPDESAGLLKSGIRYRTLYPARSRFFETVYRLEAACGLVYPLRMRDDYDIECAYLECGATKVLAGSTNKNAVKLAWVHCDLQKAMKDPAAFAQKTRKYYQKFHRVVCVSQQCRQSFRDLFGDDFPTDIVYNTVDREEILCNAEQAVSDIPDNPLVVSLGRLAEPKCYLRLLKAHKKLLEEGIFHNLLILGEGPEREVLESFVEKNGMEDTVFLPGFKTNPYPYLKAADVLACSSNYECFSTFVTEGLILGKPIVTTDVSGMRELLGDSTYGMVTDVEDEAFYEGLKNMLLDREMRDFFARKATARGTEFTTSNLVGETETFLKDIVLNRR